MRFFGLVLVCAAFVATPTGAQQSRSDGGFLYDACAPLAAGREDLSDVKPVDRDKVGFCLGYIHAAHSALSKLHDGYFKTLPDYGQLTNEAFAKRWLVSQLLLGSDVCFPDNVRPKVLAMLISKEGKENPQNLTMDMFTFAGLAFESGFPCLRRLP